MGITINNELCCGFKKCEALNGKNICHMKELIVYYVAYVKPFKEK